MSIAARQKLVEQKRRELKQAEYELMQATLAVGERLDTCMVTVRMLQCERDALNDEARRRGVSLNVLMRELSGFPGSMKVAERKLLLQRTSAEQEVRT